MKLIDLTSSGILGIFRSQYLTDTNKQMSVGSEEDILTKVFTSALATAVNRLNAGYLNTQLDTAQGVQLDAIGEMYGITRPNAEAKRRIDVILAMKSADVINPSTIITIAGVDFSPVKSVAMPIRTNVALTLETVNALSESIPVAELREGVAGLVTQESVWLRADLQSPMYPDAGLFPYTIEGDNRYREFIKARRFNKIAGIRSTITNAILDAHPQIKSCYVLSQFDDGFKDGHVTSFVRVSPFNSTLDYSHTQTALDAAKAALNDNIITIAQIVDDPKPAEVSKVFPKVTGVYSSSLDTSLITTYCNAVEYYLNSKYQVGDSVIGADIVRAYTTPLYSLGDAESLGLTEVVYNKLRNYQLIEASVGGKIYYTSGPTQYPKLITTYDLTRVKA